MAASPRNPQFAPWLDQRAHKIQDPVERLRYLREEMQALESEGRPDRFRQGMMRQWRWVSATGLAILAILATGRPSGEAQTAPTERHEAAPSRTNPAALQSGSALQAPSRIWRVDRSGNLETYSNGLRVDVTFAGPNQARGHYPVFPLEGGSEPLRHQDVPAGIVFHTTESNLADFDETQNARLKALDRNLLEVVSQEHAYHYVIDRFGRVFRVVEETDIANHSGHSIWADSTGIYVNLNDSFLAVSFEGQTGQPDSITSAQIQAGRMLTEMLRSKYSIPGGNCVTHAQVSVSGVNTHIGVHYDWASQFPFAEVGLPDNYAEPLPSMTAFGFEYDSAFTKATGGRWKGLDLAEAQVARQAALAGLPVARFRAILQHRYIDILGVVGDSEGGS